MNALLAVLICLLVDGGTPAIDAEPAASPEPDTPMGVIELSNMTLHYGPVYFDHGLHVRMSDFQEGCTVCHHDISDVNDTDAEVLACRDCHTPKGGSGRLEEPSAMAILGLKGAYHRQCLSCHQDWSHENACSYCHIPAQGLNRTGSVLVGRQGMAPRRHAEKTYVYQTRHMPLPIATFHHADHAERFGLSCVDCHHGASCGDCHGSRSVSYKMDHRMGTCFECHNWAGCVQCHDRGEKPAFDHARTAGWPLDPNHTDIGCTSCHSPEHRFDAPTSDRCKACHRVGAGGSFDHAELGVALLGDHAYIDCVLCHRGRLHIGATADCAACHTDKQFPEQLPGLGE